MRFACVFGAVLDGLRTHGAADRDLRVHAAVGAGGAVSLAALEEEAKPKNKAKEQCYSCMTAVCKEATSKTLVKASACHDSEDKCGSKKCGGNWCAVTPDECQTDLQEIAILKSDENYKQGVLKDKEKKADMEAKLASDKNTVIAAMSAVKRLSSKMEAEEIAEDAKKQAQKMKAQTHDLHLKVEDLTAKLVEHTDNLEALEEEHKANQAQVDQLEGVVKRATAAKDRMQAKRAMFAKEHMEQLNDLAEEKYARDLETKIAIATDHNLQVGGKDAADLKHCKPDLSQESEKVQELYRSMAAQEEKNLPPPTKVALPPPTGKVVTEDAPVEKVADPSLKAKADAPVEKVADPSLKAKAVEDALFEKVADPSLKGGSSLKDKGDAPVDKVKVAEGNKELEAAELEPARTGCMTEINVALKEEGAHQEDERLHRLQEDKDLAIKNQAEHDRRVAKEIKFEALREVHEEQERDASAAEQALRRAAKVEDDAEQAVDPAVAGRRPKGPDDAAECADEDSSCWGGVLKDATAALKEAKEHSEKLSEQIDDANKQNLELQTKLKKAEEALKNASVVIPDKAPEPKDKKKEAADQEKATAAKDAAKLKEIKDGTKHKKKEEAPVEKA